MNLSKPLLLTLTVASMLALTGCAGHHRHNHEPNCDRARWTSDGQCRRLNLTPEQRNSLKRLLDDSRSGRSTYQQHHDRLRVEFLTEFKSASPDAEKLRAVVEQQVNAGRLASSNLINHAMEFHASLTPQQREDLVRHLERHERKGGRFWSR